MYVQVTAAELPPSRVPAFTGYLANEVAPWLGHLAGFDGAQLMVDHDIGNVLWVTWWSSSDDVERHADTLRAIRTRTALLFSEATLSSEVFEVTAAVLGGLA